MTKLVRWTPMNPVSLFNEFDRLFERPHSHLASRDWNVALDVAENDDNYTVKATVPGINPDDMEIVLEDDVLTLKGEIKSDEEIEEADYHVRERRYGSFSRSIRFPTAVNGDKVKATYSNGILTLDVPKAESVKPKRISIKAK
jgi:HSP20 family protein